MLDTQCHVNRGKKPLPYKLLNLVISDARFFVNIFHNMLQSGFHNEVTDQLCRCKSKLVDVWRASGDGG